MNYPQIDKATKPLVLLALTLFLALLFPAFGTHADPEPEQFLPLEEVHSGMEGEAKTVIKGEEISTFSVEVVEVIDEPGELADFIVVRASGEPIDYAGGIAQGMSGSPVYFEGKLAGAISRAARWSREHENPIALITPIETMLTLMDEPEAAERADMEADRRQQAREGLQEVFPDRTVRFGDPAEAGPGELLLEETTTPVMVSGFSQPALRALKEGADPTEDELSVADPLAPLQAESDRLETGLADKEDLSFHNVEAGAGSEETLELQPGAPMGVALTRGDLSVGALGTVTYREEDRLIGLGHQFLLGGSSEFLLTEAQVHDTIASYQTPFKLGSVAEPAGAVTQDRIQGVAASLPELPSLLETDLTVTRAERTAGRFQTELVRTSELVGPLAYSTLLETVTRSLNRTGPGTVKVDYTITGADMPEPVQRSDIFFSHLNAADLPSLQVALFVDALAHNPFREPDLEELEAEITFQEEIESSQITQLSVGGRQYRPGDLVAYQVDLHQYRGEATERTGVFQIPEDLPEGEYVIAAYGGPRPAQIAPPEPIYTFEDWVGYLNEMRSYEYLSVELLYPLEEAVVPMAATGYHYESVTRQDEQLPDRVVYGRQAVAIEVTEDPEAEAEPADGELTLELEE